MTTSSNRSASPCCSPASERIFAVARFSQRRTRFSSLGRSRIDSRIPTVPPQRITRWRCDRRSSILLAALAAHTGAAVSRDELMSEVWDEHWYGPTKTLDVTMAALRRQLSDAAQEQHIPDLAFADRYYAPRLRLPPRPTPIRPGVSPNPTVIAFALCAPKPDSSRGRCRHQ